MFRYGTADAHRTDSLLTRSLVSHFFPLPFSNKTQAVYCRRLVYALEQLQRVVVVVVEEVEVDGRARTSFRQSQVAVVQRATHNRNETVARETLHSSLDSPTRL